MDTLLEDMVLESGELEGREASTTVCRLLLLKRWGGWQALMRGSGCGAGGSSAEGSSAGG